MSIPVAEEPKDPNAIVDYVIDLKALTNGNGTENYLEDAETISTIDSITTDDVALVVDSSILAAANTQIVIWLSGGTLNATHLVTARFTTSMSRTDDRSFRLKIRER